MASSRPRTPSGPSYQSHTNNNSIPTPHDPSHLSRGYGSATSNAPTTPKSGIHEQDFAATPAHPGEPSPLSQTLQSPASQSHRMGRFEEDFDARTRGSSVLLDGDVPARSASRASRLNEGAAPSRSGTLKKRSSVKRGASLKRSGSRRSAYAGSIRGVSADGEDREHKFNSVFYTPVPTSGSPTEVLANRFQAWRKLLKDLITYFREVSASYEHRAKSLLKVSNVVNNTNAPSMFMTEGGLNDANRIMRDFHQQSIIEANKARDIETEVVNQLSGLRADLGQKIKEIKSLSGDFKNSVEKEKETTRKCVAALTESLALVDSDPSAVAGKGDPYVVRLGVDRQVERQIDEENYLHRAYLNLENSGRELEAIVVGEIQKAYNALASIMKHEADEMYSTVEKLRSGPIGMPRDLEWDEFVNNDSHFVNPNIPLRRLEEIEYPGKHHPATTEVRAGMLERKSKYLKSYTPGWYVLSPTHLHEFKSADRIYTQPPVMSLYLPDQKLGSHSQPSSSSHKFVLKGRQTGSMHRGHTWVFRAETYDTMLAWYEDIKNLTEKSGEERDAFVRRHVRSVSQSSTRSVSSDGALDEDEADAIPYASQASLQMQGGHGQGDPDADHDDADARRPQRPSPGGRFPSDMQSDRNSQAHLPPSSGSSEVGHDLSAAAGGLDPNSNANAAGYANHPNHPYRGRYENENEFADPNAAGYGYVQRNPEYDYAPGYQNNAEYAYATPQQHAQQQYQPDYQNRTSTQTQWPDPNADANAYQSQPVPAPVTYQSAPPPVQAQPQTHDADLQPLQRHDSTYKDWMAPAAGGAAAGALGTAAYQQHQHQQHNDQQQRGPEDSATQAQPPPIMSEPVVPPAGYVEATPAAPMVVPASTQHESVNPHPNPGPNHPVELGTTPAAAAPALICGQGNLNSAAGEASSTSPDPSIFTDVTDVTGPISPSVRRQYTDVSVSDLHFPGEYPRAPRPS